MTRKGLFMNKKIQKLSIYAMLGLSGLFNLNCAPKLINIHVTTEPNQAKVIFTSKDIAVTYTYFAPADISYDPGLCFDPTLIVEKAGYNTKVIRLKPKTMSEEVHIVLEEKTEGQIQKQRPPQMGAPEELGDSIKQWIPDIKTETPAFDPEHNK